MSTYIAYANNVILGITTSKHAAEKLVRSERNYFTVSGFTVLGSIKCGYTVKVYGSEAVDIHIGYCDYERFLDNARQSQIIALTKKLGLYADLFLTGTNVKINFYHMHYYLNVYFTTGEPLESETWVKILNSGTNFVGSWAKSRGIEIN
jgi:hypothetical protein